MNKASLHVDQGEVVGLIGDNGAGKSTLIKTLVGVYGPDEGEIVIRGKKVFNWTALKARESGIETVFQDRALCPQQSIVWNIFMGKELRYPFGFVREKEQVKEVPEAVQKEKPKKPPKIEEKPFDEFKKGFDKFMDRFSKLSTEERSGWICSLNHGVLPKSSEFNVKYFIDSARESFSIPK